jgi:hypothetical protein
MAVVRVVPAGDLAIEDGRLVELEGAAFVRQKIATRFKFFLAEWFLDQREGVPYFRDVFVKNPNLDVISSVFRRVALSVPGVLAIPKFRASLDAASRTLTFEFDARLAGEEVLRVTPADSEFVVQF